MFECRCPTCNAKANLPNKHIGKVLRCRKCYERFVARKPMWLGPPIIPEIVSQLQQGGEKLEYAAIPIAGPGVFESICQFVTQWLMLILLAKLVPVFLVLFFCCGLPLFFSGDAAKENPPVQIPGITFIASRVDRAGNLMRLYTVDSSVDKWELMDFCRQLRAEPHDCNFFMSAFFHSGSWAEFPSVAVFTGGYELDRPELTNNLIGQYTFQKLNGFSELIYSPNGIVRAIPEKLLIP